MQISSGWKKIIIILVVSSKIICNELDQELHSNNHLYTFKKIVYYVFYEILLLIVELLFMENINNHYI